MISTTFFFLRLALLNTFKKRLRVILAIGGIALTSSVIVLLFGIQIGLRSLVDTEIQQGQSQNVVTVTIRNSNAVTLNQDQESKIQSMTGVSDIAESVGILGSSIYHDITLNVPVYGVTPNYFIMNPTTTVEGNTEALPDTQNVVVSTKVLEVFGIDKADALGKQLQLAVTLPKGYASKLTDDVTLKPQTYSIKAVVDRGELPVIYMPIETLKQNGLDSASQLSVQLTSTDKMSAVREAIEQQGLQTSSIQDTIDQINKLFSVINNILILFGIIVFVITVSSTFIIISLTLMEETHQIGFLRIMGVRHDDVRLLFVIQSITITFLGALLGAIIGVTAGFVVNGYARSLATNDTFSGAISIFVIPVVQIIMILILSVIIGWGVSIIPAKRATQLNPLEELNQ